MRLYVRNPEEADIAFQRVKPGVWNVIKNRFGTCIKGLNDVEKEYEIKKVEQFVMTGQVGSARKVKIYLQEEMKP